MAFCSVVVGVAIALLYLVLRGSTVRFVPALALLLLAAVPFFASSLSGHVAPLVAGAGGLALGIAVTVGAAALNQGGTGALPLTLGVAVAGAVALKGPARTIWGRLAAIVLLAVYASFSGRLISAAFVYPVLGVADELVDTLSRRSPPAVTTARS